jgi:hypothetical protein
VSPTADAAGAGPSPVVAGAAGVAPPTEAASSSCPGPVGVRGAVGVRPDTMVPPPPSERASPAGVGEVTGTVAPTVRAVGGPACRGACTSTRRCTAVAGWYAAAAASSVTSPEACSSAYRARSSAEQPQGTGPHRCTAGACVLWGRRDASVRATAALPAVRCNPSNRLGEGGAGPAAGRDRRPGCAAAGARATSTCVVAVIRTSRVSLPGIVTTTSPHRKAPEPTLHDGAAGRAHPHGFGTCLALRYPRWSAAPVRACDEAASIPLTSGSGDPERGGIVAMRRDARGAAGRGNRPDCDRR